MYEKTVSCLPLPLLGIQPNCHWPIIEQLNIHVRPEDAACDLQPIRGYCIPKTFAEGLGDFRRRRIRKTRTPSPAYICIERKLRDDQHFSTNIEQRTVHLALIIAKDTQVGNFISQGL